jgi:2-amino-4-hydroxy-6-hydroxymethyldihydropteridine diphosphokinase
VVKAYLSLGSNLDRERHLRQALAELAESFGELEISSLYESEAEGFKGPPFYNLVVGFNTDLPLAQVLKILKTIELRHGRSQKARKFTSRTLDLDLILFGDQIVHDPKTSRLIVPREDILRYAFVLEPLAEIAPHLRHPQVNKTYLTLWQSLGQAGKQKRLPLEVIGYDRHRPPAPDR